MSEQRVAEPTIAWRASHETVRSKRIYETADPSDGLRVLATQYWPRGVSRDSVDEYLRILAPSRVLLHSFRDADIDWARYKRRYLAEMRGEAQQAEIHRLAKLSRSQNVTVLCVCENESQCHRSLLRNLIARFNQ